MHSCVHLICQYSIFTHSRLICVVAGNPDLVDMLPHMRGQGVLDLEYESDGEWAGMNVM